MDLILSGWLDLMSSFTSIVVTRGTQASFSSLVSTADRRFIYVDVGRPGLLGDSTIYSMSTLTKNIEENVRLGDDVPSLCIAGVPIRPYLIGDCAFALDIHLMKSCS